VIAAHVAGVPVEELLPLAGGGAALIAARAWLGHLMRRTPR